MSQTKPKSTLLIGPPGTGKTIMACTTAVHPPVHVIDFDRKIGSNARLEDFIKRELVTYDEVAETVNEESMLGRLRQLANNETITRQPQGWLKFAEMVHSLPKNERAMRAGTWLAPDSMTVAAEHAKSLIMFYAKKPKLQFDQWSALLSVMRDTLQALRDLAREHGKDLIVTVHEKMREVPGDRVTGITVTKTGENTTRSYDGRLDPKILPTIDGSFSTEMAAYFDEVYALSVEVGNSGEPKWVCRVQPDGKRDLRTSFNVKQAEFPPDFKLIWK